MSSPGWRQDVTLGWGTCSAGLVSPSFHSEHIFTVLWHYSMVSKTCFQTEKTFCKFKCRGMSGSMQFDLLTCVLLRTPGWAPYRVENTALHAWGWPWPRSASLGLKPGTHFFICSQQSYWLRGMFYWASSLCSIHDEQMWVGFWSPALQK